MPFVITALLYCCKGIAGVAVTLLGVTFTKLERQRHRALGRLDRMRVQLFVTAVVCVVIVPFLEAWDRGLESRERRQGEARLLAELQRLSVAQGPQTGILSADPRTAAAEFAAATLIVATDAFGRHEYEEALRRYADADRYVTSASLKARIADCYYYLGEYARAIPYEVEAERLAPDWSGPPYLLAICYRALGDTARAKAAAERSCRLGFEGACQLREALEAPTTPAPSPRRGGQP